MPNTKIATCCYCGNRTALVLRGQERHELSCASCGAPLHEMKRLRSDHVGKPTAHAHLPAGNPRRPRREPKRNKKRSKSFKRYLLKAAFEAIEDVFD